MKRQFNALNIRHVRRTAWRGFGLQKMAWLLALAAAAPLFSPNLLFSAEEELVIAPRPQPVPLTAEQLAQFKKAIGDRDSAKAGAAAEQLASYRDPATLPIFLEMYSMGDAQRRLGAVKALGELRLPQTADTLLKIAIGDPFIAIRQAAAAALGHGAWGEKNIAALAELVDGNAKRPPADPIYQFRAMQALTRIGGKKSGDLLAGWTKLPSPMLASAAVDALGSLGEMRYAETLVAMLGSADPEIQPAAADALERLSGQPFRFDLIQWTEWLKTKERRKADATAPSRTADADTSPSDDAYEDDGLPSTAATDIVIVFDTTGSMTHIWPLLCNAADAVLQGMIKQSPSLRMGLVLYRADNEARSTKYTIKPVLLTRQYKQIRDEMDDALFGGGSGGVHLGLDYALKTMPWRTHARKVVILIGDTSPPPEGVKLCMQSIREAWELDRILVTTLYVRTVHGEEHRQTYSLLSQSGAGRFYEFNKAWNRLVELSARDINEQGMEKPEDTARKWLTPRNGPR
jgi:HEAT repeat protein